GNIARPATMLGAPWKPKPRRRSKAWTANPATPAPTTGDRLSKKTDASAMSNAATAQAVGRAVEGATAATPAMTNHVQRALRDPARVTSPATAPLRTTSAGRQPAGWAPAAAPATVATATTAQTLDDMRGASLAGHVDNSAAVSG